MLYLLGVIIVLSSHCSAHFVGVYVRIFPPNRRSEIMLKYHCWYLIFREHENNKSDDLLMLHRKIPLLKPLILSVASKGLLLCRDVAMFAQDVFDSHGFMTMHFSGFNNIKKCLRH